MSGQLVTAAEINRLSLAALEQLTSNQPEVVESSQLLNISSVDKVKCRVTWISALIAHHKDDFMMRDEHFTQLLSCEPERAKFIRAFVDDDTSWADRFLKAYPENAEALLWMGDTLRMSDPERAAEYYKQGLALKPFDPKRWLYYGDTLREMDPEAAIQAYLQACRYGDPGYHGCSRAGLTAESIGDYESALGYYRLSRWEGSHKRADELEAKIEAGELP
jgi:tetratricopeptide (TPR) repeat protein